MTTLITNCRLIDGVSQEVRPSASVAIEKGRITKVTSDGTGIDRNGKQVIDCNGGWLLPGLWDVHIHLQFPDISPPDDAAVRTIRYGINAMEGLREAGVTAIRTAGTDNWIDVAWKNVFAAGELQGPRIFAGGYFLTTTAGHGHGQPFALQCDGPQEFLRAVRQQIENGVDHIKLDLSGGVMGPPWDRQWHNFLLEEELEAVFRLCCLRDMKVMSHATNAQAVKDAVRLGTWSVEHGYEMDEDCIQMMMDKGVFYIPTLGVTHLTPAQATTHWEKEFMKQWSEVIPGEFLARADDAARVHRKWFQTALSAGVKMAIGSDLGPLKEATLMEMGCWVRAGATPMQTIKAATAVAAEVCGVEHDLGTVEEGKIADLILVKDDPLKDVNNLRTLQMVFKDGKLIVDKRASS